MEQYLQHHGILRMHWGIRRYQNKDGTLTEAGKKRYLTNVSRKGYESINWDTDAGLTRKEKSKEREFMKKINSEFTKTYDVSNKKFDEDFDAINRSTDKDTIDVVNKTFNHQGGDEHYLDRRTFDEYKKRYADCGTEAQLKKSI